MEPQNRSVTPDDGPALDLGDLDWTIPPDSVLSDMSPRSSLGYAAARFRIAMGYAVVAMGLTGLGLGWWVASGVMPADDPDVGAFALVLHILSFGAAWLALRASVETWQALYLQPGRSRGGPRGNLTQVISLASACVMCFHAAMVVSSILR